MLADTKTASDKLDMPFERKPDVEGVVVTRGIREYRDDSTGQIIYGGSLILVSESRETIERILEQVGGQPLG